MGFFMISDHKFSNYPFPKNRLCSDTDNSLSEMAFIDDIWGSKAKQQKYKSIQNIFP